MVQAPPLPMSIAGGIGAAGARLVTGPWRAAARGWMRVVALAVALGIGAYLAFRFIARRRQS